MHASTRNAIERKKRRSSRPLLLASAPLMSLLACDALAQPSDDSATTTALPQVTVTAQRVEESAQNVGIALTALQGDDLQKKGVTLVNQLQNYVPNLDIAPQYGSGNPLFRIRGVGLKDYGSNNTSTVGVLILPLIYGHLSKRRWPARTALG
ncbi:MAG: hypothetical protein GAK43_01774 [Stenotrophomonas maltophilia]|nr:MAG: hypothetical protein GAK43_01774 [Stenotrophomonas maltophilia]